MSFTVTINRHKLEFALESVAVYITDVAPELKKEPGTLLLVKLAKCVSVARGAVHVTFAPHAPGIVDTTCADGQFRIAGTMVSITFTVNVSERHKRLSFTI